MSFILSFINHITSLEGKDWKKTHKVDWSRIPHIIGTALKKQLHTQHYTNKIVDISRVSVFTSMKPETVLGGTREQMISDFYKANFDVHIFETKNSQEKCVDISLAVEMLYLAIIPHSYDIAVIVTGRELVLYVIPQFLLFLMIVIFILMAQHVEYCIIVSSRPSYHHDKYIAIDTIV